LKNNDIDDQCIAILLKTISSHLVSLCHLDLSHNKISNKTCYAFAKYFNAYTLKIAKGGHHYLAINNPEDINSSDNDYAMNRNSHFASFAMPDNDDEEELCGFLFDRHRKSYPYSSIQDLTPFRSIEVQTSTDSTIVAADCVQPIDPSKCTSLCQVNIKKCKNIGNEGIAALIAMFVNPSKSKVRFRITKGDKEKYNHGVSFYNNKENKGHSKILTHSNWRYICQHFSIRNENILKWENLLQTRKYDRITADKCNLKTSLPPLPQLPVPSMLSCTKNSNRSHKSNKSDSDINLNPLNIVCIPQRSNTSIASNSNEPSQNNHNLRICRSNSNNSNHYKSPRLINNILSLRYSNHHSNTSNHWEFDDCDEFTPHSHSAGSNHQNPVNFVNHSSAHIAMGQSIELNAHSMWHCYKCKNSNLKVFQNCTQCGMQLIHK